MSDNKHTGQTKFTAWVDIVQLQKLDDKIKELGYTSRTEWFREKMRETINDKPPQK
jgi:metal-responsive CopG/Arc/MetJ family transcriptional regulator